MDATGQAEATLRADVSGGPPPVPMMSGDDHVEITRPVRRAHPDVNSDDLPMAAGPGDSDEADPSDGGDADPDDRQPESTADAPESEHDRDEASSVVEPVESDAEGSGQVPAGQVAPVTVAPDVEPGTAPPTGPVPGVPGPIVGSDARADDDRDLERSARRLRNQIAAVSLALDIPKASVARKERELLLAQLDDYLLPRLARMDAPLLAVIGGSTGAGKSTLTNSLARKVVSRSGVLRPTTRSPVLVHHPYDSGAFLTQRILPDLARITSEALEPLQPIELDAPRITALRLVPHEGLAPGLALLDAPDIDSVVEANRDLAVQLLGAADLWLFVTTAARYGDAMPWQMLRTAAERGVSVAVVLDRVPPESLQEVRGHLARMLRDHGLGSSPMFVIPELPLHDGLLPWNVVAPLHRWLMRLAQDARAREVVIRRTLAGIVDSLPRRGRLLVSAAAEQEVAAHVLGTELDAVFATARSSLTRRLVNGTVLRGEVLARWRELIGNGELVRHLERATGRFAGRMVAALRKTPPLPTEPLGQAVASAVAATIDASLHAAVDQALARWQELPGGPGLVTRTATAGTGSVVSGSVVWGSASCDARPEDRVDELVRQWQSRVLDAVRRISTRPNTTGRSLALRPESVAVLVTFIGCTAARQDDAGLPPVTPGSATTSGELPTVEIADGAALAGRLLDVVYGATTVRQLVDAAREDLRRRVEELLSTERAALKALLDEAKVRPGVSDALLAAVRVVEDAR